MFSCEICDIFKHTKYEFLTDFFRYEKITANASIMKPYTDSFAISKSSGIQSNAFGRSIKIASTVKF